MGQPDKKSPTAVDSPISSPSLPISHRDIESSLLELVKRSPKTVSWCLALTVGIILYGYDLVIVGNVSSMPEFQYVPINPMASKSSNALSRRDFGQTLNGKLIIPSLWLGLWNTANPFGGILGALAGGYIQDRNGRRRALTVASLASAIGVAVAYVSNLPGDITGRRGVFFVAKLVQGFAVNMAMCTAQTYMSEVLPPGLRGPILAFFPIFTLLGQLLGSIVVYVSLDKPGVEGYKSCFISEWAVSVLPLLLSVLMPESPAYLIRKGLFDAARKQQRRLASSEKEAHATLEQTRLSIELENQNTKGIPPSYIDCFKGINRRRTTIVIWANIFPQLFGLTLLAKASYFMQVVGMGAHDSLVFLQVGIGLGITANIGSILTLAKVGRVPLTLFGFAVSNFLWTGMGIAGCFSGTVTVWYTQITLMLVIIVCGLSTWPASYAFGAEASSLQLRAKTQGLGWLVNCLTHGVLGLVLPYIFNDDEGALGAKTGFIYTGFCIIGLIVTWAIVPEMKNRTTMEVDKMFQLGISARRFKGWRERGDEGISVSSFVGTR
ncbi:general substrate transporter [Aspergillus lucknowensis]|uniref:General substrate transporter n=1 Tax=Aspergillus lucknowensis TaxID=176173 RepID=A0ABR4LXA1_9EURO